MKTIKTVDRAVNIPKKLKFTKKIARTSPKVFTDNLGKNDENNSSLQLEKSPIYGVLGIGRLGSTLVINLLKMKKRVYIWNRTNEKCTRLLQELDSVGRSYIRICHIPGLVIKRSDIIFNCISDGDGSMEIIESCLSKKNATDNFMQDKGLIDMSGVGPDGQKQLCKIVEDKGGQYLEVRIQQLNEIRGSGYLFIVGGNMNLFEECEYLFKVLGAETVFLKEQIGYVTTLNLSLQLMKSVCLMGITEGCSLLERMVPLDAQHKLLQILMATPIYSDYMKNKIFMIFGKNFGISEQSLQNLEKDVKMGLDMSDNVLESMRLSSLVHQMLKHCHKLGYGEFDPSAVFMRIRH